jgi:hypothetical protein
MPHSVDALVEKSQILLAAIQSGTQDHRLTELVDDRQQEIRQWVTALQEGTPLPPGVAEELLRLDRELLAAVADRHAQIHAELALLQRGRRAGMAYRSPRGAPARFVDRAS